MNGLEVKDWLELASHDETTAYLIKEHNGYPDIGIYHLIKPQRNC
jgi:hypothetical protein